MDSRKIIINKNWKFYYGACDEAFYKGYDDSNFQEVSLPHDWSVTMPFEITNSSGTGYLPGGTAWYRLHFSLPQEFSGKHILLCFDGIYKNSHVWVNSYNLGKHPYGYTPVYCDISDFVSFGDIENVIAVKVVHEDIADSRWFTGSGITRKATIIAEEKLHPVIDGTYLYTTGLNGKDASFTVHHEVKNDSLKEKEIIITHTIVDAEGATVWSKSMTSVPKVNGTMVLDTEGTISDVNLWDINNPYLYTLRTSYSNGEDSYICYEEPCGFRMTRFDADEGFFLNENNIKIKGVCVHHDAGVLGAAVTEEVWERRLEKLKECGTNAIRCSHNPHMPELYELCDRMGFLMMDEAFDEWECPKNKWSTGHNVYPPKHQGYAEDFPEWYERDLRAMVRRDRKHPSIIMWSIGNEIDYPNDPYCHPSFETMTGNNDASKPMQERMYDPNKPNAERMVAIAKNLSRIVKEEDCSKPVTMALAFPELSSRLGIFSALDFISYNYKEHLYEKDHADYPQYAFLGSENGHEYAKWLAVKDNPYISGQFIWTGIDYLGESKGPWPIHGAAAGLLDLAGFEKHQFLMRKSYWCDTPVLEMATRVYEDENNEKTPMYESWNYEEGQNIMVSCFSNLKKVSIFCNGIEVGTMTGCNFKGYYSFCVGFVPGELLAIAYDDNDKEVIRKVITTSKEVSGFEAKIWQKPDGAQEGYLYQIEVSLIDKDSALVTNEDVTISVSVNGAGILKGLENGDLADITPYSEAIRKTNHGKILIYVQRISGGEINVIIEAKKDNNIIDEKCLIIK